MTGELSLVGVVVGMIERRPVVRAPAPEASRCQTCGAELQDATQRFCGGDRCLHVFMPPRTSGPWSASLRRGRLS